MGSRLSYFKSIFYDSKRHEFIGRDGNGWAKLAIVYSLYYFVLAGFFCTMMVILMLITPQDVPRYFSTASCMQSRSNPLSPGMGFRPHPNIEENLVYINKNATNFAADSNVKNLNQYLELYYRNHPSELERFNIPDPQDCTSKNHYGFSDGKPCVLVKMNKVVGFNPIPGYQKHEQDIYENAGCQSNPNAIAVHCYGEYASDVDNIGDITYISENGPDNKCGSLDRKWFPYKGKKNRQDVYQVPYVWVQFKDLKPNVLIHVVCRLYAENINFDRKSAGLTRFKLFLKDLSKNKIQNSNFSLFIRIF